MRRLPPAVILAAGESSRFWPLSSHGHKSLHRLCGRSVIEHTISSLSAAGVRDIVIVQSPKLAAREQPNRFPHRPISDQLEDGSRYGVMLRYATQSRPDGQGSAILAAAELVADSDFFVVQPENINAGALVRELMEQRRADSAVISVQERPETWLFGVIEHHGSTIRRIIEKPPPGTEPSRLCNMGVYLLPRDYLDVLAAIAPGPLANIIALERLAARNRLQATVSHHPFFPLKYPWHLFAMAAFLKPSDRPYLGERAIIDPAATIDQRSVIEADAVIGPGVVLEQALVGAGSKINSSLTDTITGAAVSVAAGVSVEHRRLDDGHVTVDVRGHHVTTNLPRMGAVLGAHSRLLSGSRLAAGVLVGAGSEVTDGSFVEHNVPESRPAKV